MTKVVFTLYVPVVVLVLCFGNIVRSEPPVSNSGGWGQQQQQQNSGGYAQSNSQQSSGGYSSNYGPPAAGGGQNSGGYSQQPQPLQNNGGGWGQQQQAQVQSNNNNGGWGQGQQQQQQQQSGGGGWGGDNQNQMKAGGGGGNGGWGPQLNLELDTANLKVETLSPTKIFKSIIGIPRRVIMFIRESGLYLLFIPLIIILPLMLLAFNVGRTFGVLRQGWGWGRSLKAVESEFVGYMKSPVWQKIGKTLRDERVFERVMKSIEEFNKDW